MNTALEPRIEVALASSSGKHLSFDHQLIVTYRSSSALVADLEVSMSRSPTLWADV